MNILILNWRDSKNPRSGGAEIVTMEHAKRWVAAGHNVTWFTSSYPESPKRETVNGVHLVRLFAIPWLYLMAPIYYLFGKRKYDLVIDEIHGLPFYTPLYVRKPKIAFIHEVAEEIWDYMFPFPLNKIGRLAENMYFYLYRGVRFWTDAPSTIEDLVHHGIERRLCLAIPCPVDRKTLSSMPVKEKIPTFVFISRVVKMKGVEEIIRAFTIILKSMNARLWIIGGGEEKYLYSLKEMILETGMKSSKVKFFGRITEKNKYELLGKAHLLLHASVKEGWGLVVLEAASQATPSVVYNVGGLRDSVINGRTGVVLNNNSPEHLAREALSLIADRKRYARFQRECLNYVKRLTWDSAAEKSLNLIKATVNK